MKLVLAVCLLLGAGDEIEDWAPTGSVASNGNVTTFSADRVVSPNANVSRRADGSWAGMLSGQPVDLAVNEKGLRGVNVNLTVATDKGQTTAAGLVFGKPFRLMLSKGRIDVRLGKVVDQYTREENGTWRPLAPSTRYSLELTGQAAEASPPLPQLVLAFIANGVTARR